MIFDLSGNYIQKLPVTNIEHFRFYQDELYWLKDENIYFYHLYNMRKRQMKLPGPNNAQFVCWQKLKYGYIEPYIIKNNSNIFVKVKLFCKLSIIFINYCENTRKTCRCFYNMLGIPVCFP